MVHCYGITRWICATSAAPQLPNKVEQSNHSLGLFAPFSCPYYVVLPGQVFSCCAADTPPIVPGRWTGSRAYGQPAGRRGFDPNHDVYCSNNTSGTVQKMVNFLLIYIYIEMNIHFFRQNEPPSPHDIRKKRFFSINFRWFLLKIDVYGKNKNIVTI